MKYLINLLILGAVVLLAYLLYYGINEPIKFKDELDSRKTVVTDKLTEIRKAQEIYRDIKGEYAGTFDTLAYVLTNDSIPIRQLVADPEDPDNPDKFITNLILRSAKDSIDAMGIDLGDLPFVPYTDKSKRFTMVADTTTYQQTLVPVLEVMTKWSDFMGEFSDPRFSMFQKDYNPAARLGFGSLNSPNLEGNWK